MSDESDNGGFLATFKAGFQKGYDKQDAVIKTEKEKSSDTQRIADGVITGSVEGILNPVRWIAAIFR